MTGRAFAESVVGFVLTALLSILGAGLLHLESGLPGAFLDEGLNFLGLGFPFGAALWLVFLLVGNLVNRRRSSAVKFATNAISLLVAATLNCLVWVVIAAIEGGWMFVFVAFSIGASVVVLVAGVAALAVTHFALFRSRS